jgi:hypothetical protein
MKLRLLLFFLFTSLNCIAQTKIAGRIVDEKTNQPIAGASVYLNNSSCGTETDEGGKFVLSCTVIGKAELVFSHILYEKKVQVIESGKGDSLLISLKPQDNTLNEVVIRNKKYSIADATKWINLFTTNLIGRYTHSSSCKFKNPEVLYFDFDKTNNQVAVYAKGPLIIENEFLAYNIRLDLDKFEYNFNTNEVFYTYSCLYENKKQSKLSEKEIQENRKLAYEGSAMHFMRSVFRNNLEIESFSIYKYTAIRNREQERVSTIINKRVAEVYAKEERPSTSLLRFFSLDTVKYYQMILRQDPIKSFKTTPVNIRKLITKDKATRTVNLNFTDTLLVSYDKTKLNVEKQIAASLGKNKDNPKVVKPVYLSSYLYFFKDGGINIQLNGYYSEASLFMYGDMSERRIGMSLPLDFDEDHPLK